MKSFLCTVFNKKFSISFRLSETFEVSSHMLRSFLQESTNIIYFEGEKIFVMINDFLYTAEAADQSIYKNYLCVLQRKIIDLYRIIFVH